MYSVPLPGADQALILSLVVARISTRTFLLHRQQGPNNETNLFPRPPSSAPTHPPTLLLASYPPPPSLYPIWQALGMTLLRRRSLLPHKTQQVCWMGYGEEDDSTLLELVYEYNREKIDRGDGYGQVKASRSCCRYRCC